MRQTVRIQKKIVSYSYFCKVLGIIDETEYNKITKECLSKNKDYQEVKRY